MVGHRFYQGDGGLASQVYVNYPHNVAYHPITEDLFIADTNNHVIRKVDSMGVITTVAGTPGESGYAGDDGLATQAKLYYPSSIAFSLDGQSMYIADYYNHRVRMVKNGNITTVAGNGDGGFGGDNILATSTSLYLPFGVAVLPTTGELVISDSDNHRIRKVDSNGIIATIAGTGTRTGDGGAPLGDNGLATNATLNYPAGIVVNSNGEIFIADQNNYRIRKIDTSGGITTVAGTGGLGTSGNNVPAISAKIGFIGGLAINSDDDLFMADQFNHCIRKVTGDSQSIITVAGTCGTSKGYNGENVSATTAKLNSPRSVAVKSNGEFVIADTDNHRIRKVTTNGIINTIAGNGFAEFSGGSGIAFDTTFGDITSVTVTNNGEVIISDVGYQKIRKVDRNGIITAFAGNGMAGFGGDGGSALNALLNNAGTVVVTDDGDVLFADTKSNRIRKVYRNGTIETIAGNGAAGFISDEILATSTSLNQPRSVAYQNGVVYIADTENHRIRKISTNGTIITIAGSENSGYCGDGGLAVNACVNRPVSVVVNNAGDVFISDQDNHEKG